MFQVLENGKPADCRYFNVSPDWECSQFDAFEDAEAYARVWLGEWGYGLSLKLGEPCEYNNNGDKILIKQI